MKKNNLKIICKVVLCQAGFYLGYKILKKMYLILLRVLQKNEILTNVVNRSDMYEKWIENIHIKKNIGECLNDKNIKNIIICIWNRTAELFVDEIKDFVNINCIVDSDRDLNQPFEIVDSLDRVENRKVDLIVVMEPESYDDYYREFHNEFDCPILSIDELIAGLY